MIPPDHPDRDLLHRRIRRTKKMLRPLPRKATIHRYPVLKRFKDRARKCAYLWSFRRKQVVRAIYIGSILSLLPVYGLQLIASFFICLKFRANLMIMCALQMITNPVTAVPLYILGYQVGDRLMRPFIGDRFTVTEEEIKNSADTGLWEGLQILWDSILNASWEKIAYAFTAISLGGVVIGYFLGFVLSCLYQWLSQRSSGTYAMATKEQATTK